MVNLFPASATDQSVNRIRCAPVWTAWPSAVATAVAEAVTLAVAVVLATVAALAAVAVQAVVIAPVGAALVAREALAAQGNADQLVTKGRVRC